MSIEKETIKYVINMTKIYDKKELYDVISENNNKYLIKYKNYFGDNTKKSIDYIYDNHNLAGGGLFSIGSKIGSKIGSVFGKVGNKFNKTKKIKNINKIKNTHKNSYFKVPKISKKKILSKTHDILSNYNSNDNSNDNSTSISDTTNNVIVTTKSIVSDTIDIITNTITSIIDGTTNLINSLFHSIFSKNET